MGGDGEEEGDGGVLTPRPLTPFPYYYFSHSFFSIPPRSSPSLSPSSILPTPTSQPPPTPPSPNPPTPPSPTPPTLPSPTLPTPPSLSSSEPPSSTFTSTYSFHLHLLHLYRRSPTISLILQRPAPGDFKGEDTDVRAHQNPFQLILKTNTRLNL